MEEKQEVTVRQSIDTSLTTKGGLIPTNLEQLWRLATIMAKSGMMPKGIETPEAVCVAIQMGLEVGLSPMQAVQNIAVINGRPSVWGEAGLALVEASGAMEDFRETMAEDKDGITATCWSKRKNRPTPVERTFSTNDAKRASLWGKSGPWAQYPRRMLQMRARWWVLRDLYPDVLKGLKAAEEVQDYIDLVPAQPTQDLPPKANGNKVAYQIHRPASQAAAEEGIRASEEIMAQAEKEPQEDPPAAGEKTPEVSENNGEKLGEKIPPKSPKTETPPSAPTLADQIARSRPKAGQAAQDAYRALIENNLESIKGLTRAELNNAKGKWANAQMGPWPLDPGQVFAPEPETTKTQPEEATAPSPAENGNGGVYVNCPERSQRLPTKICWARCAENKTCDVLTDAEWENIVAAQNFPPEIREDFDVWIKDIVMSNGAELQEFKAEILRDAESAKRISNMFAKFQQHMTQGGE